MGSTIALDLSGLLGNDGGDVGDRGNREYGCSLFPGQIVAVEGINPSGRTMRVTRVIEGVVIRDRRFSSTGLSYQLIGEPALSGEVAISVTPKRPRLLEQLNDGLDRLKRNGRFDRINTEFLPFRLQ